MTFAIHASRNDHRIVTIRISPVVAVDKARLLQSLGWRVHITDSAGHQFSPSEFHQLPGRVPACLPAEMTHDVNPLT